MISKDQIQAVKTNAAALFYFMCHEAYIFETESNFLVPKLFGLKNIVPLLKYSAFLQKWADWLGQAGTNKWAE